MNLKLNISAQYGHFLLAVKQDIPLDGVTAIYGPSGSGKTSLLRAIAGLDQARNSHVYFNQEQWQNDGYCKAVHARRLAYVFQEPSLFEHLTVLENLNYAFKRVPSEQRQYTPEYAAALLSIDELLDRSVLHLSGGERQRVAIARAICSNPKLLLMDEPLASLDSDAKRQIMMVLESFYKTLDIPIIYVSHSLNEVARLAENLLLMESGKIIANGKTQSMLSDLGYSLAQSNDAESMVNARFSREGDHGVSYLASEIGEIAMLSSVLNSNGELTSEDPLRVMIKARDVSVTLEHQSNTSILNIFKAKVDEIYCDDDSQVTVKASINGIAILAKITQKSSLSMHLAQGVIVYLQIKSIALI